VKPVPLVIGVNAKSTHHPRAPCFHPLHTMQPLLLSSVLGLVLLSTYGTAFTLPHDPTLYGGTRRPVGGGGVSCRRRLHHTFRPSRHITPSWGAQTGLRSLKGRASTSTSSPSTIGDRQPTTIDERLALQAPPEMSNNHHVLPTPKQLLVVGLVYTLTLLLGVYGPQLPLIPRWVACPPPPPSGSSSSLLVAGAAKSAFAFDDRYTVGLDDLIYLGGSGGVIWRWLTYTKTSPNER
jgi:hypothetical protein